MPKCVSERYRSAPATLRRMRVRRPCGLAIALVATSLAGAPASHATDVAFSVRVPADTAAGAGDVRLYVSGDVPALGTWRADGLALTRQGDRWTARVDVGAARRIEFKVTRGSWDRCEVWSDGRERPNRVVELPDGAAPDAPRVVLVDVTVEAWRAPRTPTRSGDIRSLTVPGDAGGDVPGRELLVLLPEGYGSEDAAARRYPVVWFLDGQNVFDASTSYIGVEWQADETALRLAKEGAIEPIIVVAVPNTSERTREYTFPSGDGTTADGRGDAFLSWLVGSAKREVDARFRTRTDAASTTIAGSSLGGLFALEAIERRPTTFGNAIAMSPSLWRGDEALLRRWSDGATRPTPRRLWIDMGTAEGSLGGGGHVERVKRLAALFGDTPNVRLVIDDGALHDETAWQRRLPDALAFVLYSRAVRNGIPASE